MSNQNYCMVNIETNICDNICVWDGNPDTWTPPAHYLMLIQTETLAKVWVWENAAWVLQEQLGAGSVGFTWDGTVLTTNEPLPAPLVQPTVAGAQTL